MSGTMFRGVSLEQDKRFRDKDEKELRKRDFPPNFTQKVDLAKVKMEVVRSWVSKKVTSLMNGVEDDVLVGFVMNLLEEKDIDPRKMQISITGFMGAKRAAQLMAELWAMLLDAQSKSGIPTAILEQTKQDLLNRREESNRVMTRIETSVTKEEPAPSAEVKPESWKPPTFADMDKERQELRQKHFARRDDGPREREPERVPDRAPGRAPDRAPDRRDDRERVENRGNDDRRPYDDRRRDERRFEERPRGGDRRDDRGRDWRDDRGRDERKDDGGRDDRGRDERRDPRRDDRDARPPRDDRGRDGERGREDRRDRGREEEPRVKSERKRSRSKSLSRSPPRKKRRSPSRSPARSLSPKRAEKSDAEREAELKERLKAQQRGRMRMDERSD